MPSGGGIVRSVAAALLVASSGCGGPQTQADFDPQVDFESYRTFTMGPRPEGERPARVQDLIAGELRGKGLEEVPEGGDLLIDWEGSVFEDLPAKTSGEPGDATDYTSLYVQGVITIEAVDARTNERVWRGWADVDLERDDVWEEGSRLIEDILGRFPRH